MRLYLILKWNGDVWRLTEPEDGFRLVPYPLASTALASIEDHVDALYARRLARVSPEQAKAERRYNRSLYTIAAVDWPDPNTVTESLAARLVKG